MRAGDLDRVLSMERQIFGAGAWTYGMLSEELGARGRWYVVATDRRTDTIGPAPVVGYAGLWFDGHAAQIMTIGVAADHRRRGIGAMLLEALVGRARDQQAEAVLLEVAVTNSAALALYESWGFARLGLRKRYYQPEDLDAWTMRLSLPGPLSAERRTEPTKP